MIASELNLAFGLSFDQLHSHAGLNALDAVFLNWLTQTKPGLASRLVQARQHPPLEHLAESLLLIELAHALDAFLPRLFAIETAAQALRDAHLDVTPVLRVKYKFVKRQALLGIEPEQRELLDAAGLRAQLLELGADPANEPAFANCVARWTDQLKSKDSTLKAAARSALDVCRDYAAWAAGTDKGRLAHQHSVLFNHPQLTDPYNRIEHLQTSRIGSAAAAGVEHPIKIHRIKPAAAHFRDGFALTDQGTDLAGAIDQAKYCLLCHKSGKDSCSHGLLATDSKNTGDADGADRFKRSALGEALGGCPLEERISEFHQLKLEGAAIGALAMIALDNPMVAATGHRICNDCMKACIYQQQTPVDIPQAETRVLRDVLELPWGFEIYGLLTRWNPLNLKQWLPAQATGKKILIIGAGPAGFTLAHYLLNHGHSVTLIDGLKIEPGPNAAHPVQDVSVLREPLETRVAGGFGGVAEYGITVRWDKNFLTLIRVLLERRSRFALVGGVRFGGTLTTQEAFELGFDHIALCTGAGRPNLLDIPNGLAPGVRAASDFLMALQLTGAGRRDSLANLQVRLPALVIGGGLTAMDTATETTAYYLAQIEKFLARHEALVAVSDEQTVRMAWSANDQLVAQEFIRHGLALRAERERAQAAGENPHLQALIKQWGGVSVAYRKRLVDSPAYRLNPEEVSNALAEGISIIEGIQPLRVNIDVLGQCESMVVMVRERHQDGDWRDVTEQTLPARSIFMATGTRPNAVLAQEEPESYSLDGQFFAAIEADGDSPSARVAPGAAPKPLKPAIFCHQRDDGRRVSFLGDAHPGFAGNVVRAVSSGKTAAPLISELLANFPAANNTPSPQWQEQINHLLAATVTRVERLAPGIVEVVVKAPAAARAFKPGQFYRLQNFEHNAVKLETLGQPTRLGMEGLAMTGAWTNHERGEIGLIVLEMGGSSDLCAALKPDEPVVLMGPTGTPTEIVAHSKVILIGGGLGNAVLFSIGAALRAAGSQVLYFAGYKRHADRFRPEDIEAAADQIIWCCDEAPGFEARRPGDQNFVGNVLEAMRSLNQGLMGDPLFALGQADRVITIGSDRMMAAVAHACANEFNGILAPDVKLIASINSPMQCMMKEICAQCLQRHVDPITGQTSIVFSCANQDQPMDFVDFECLAGRLSQNALQEKQTGQWLKQTAKQLK